MWAQLTKATWCWWSGQTHTTTTPSTTRYEYVVGLSQFRMLLYAKQVRIFSINLTKYHTIIGENYVFLDISPKYYFKGQLFGIFMNRFFPEPLKPKMSLFLIRFYTLCNKVSNKMIYCDVSVGNCPAFSSSRIDGRSGIEPGTGYPQVPTIYIFYRFMCIRGYSCRRSYAINTSINWYRYLTIYCSWS